MWNTFFLQKKCEGRFHLNKKLETWMSQTHNTFLGATEVASLSKDFDVDALHRPWNQGIPFKKQASLLIKIVF